MENIQLSIQNTQASFSLAKGKYTINTAHRKGPYSQGGKIERQRNEVKFEETPLT